MKKIFLTGQNGSIIGNYALVDDEDFCLVSKFNWRACGGKHGVYYAVSGNRDKEIRMHRLILNIKDRKIQVDHINHNGLDNRRINIRKCTNGQNKMNSRKIRGASIYKGVVWSKKSQKWLANIKHNGKIIFLGAFDNQMEAAYIYNIAAIKFRPDFSVLNDVDKSIISHDLKTRIRKYVDFLYKTRHDNKPRVYNWQTRDDFYALIKSKDPFFYIKEKERILNNIRKREKRALSKKLHPNYRPKNVQTTLF